MKIKNSICILFLCIMAVCGMTGCGKEAKNRGNPNGKEFEKTADFYLYNSLTDLEKTYYAHLCTAIEEFKSEAIFRFKTPEERAAIQKKFFNGEVRADRFIPGGELFFRDMCYEQSQYFWVDPNHVTPSVRDLPKGDGYLLTVKLNYLMDKDEAMAKKDAFDRKVEEIVSQARAAGGTFEQVLYVHDYLCENVIYDKALYEEKQLDTPIITAYGALMEGKTVCSGYTQAFELLMRELGYDCGAEFTNYGKVSGFEGHVWNYVELDGEYYYFDLTWDDQDIEEMPISYEYFGLTTEELKETHYTKQDDAPVPYCGGTKYNYYVYKGFDVPQYSFESASAVIEKQVNADGRYICLRFGSYEDLLRAETELFDRKRIFELVNAESVNHFISSNSPKYLYIGF